MIEITNIEPLEAELPSDYADRLGVFYTKRVTLKHKKENGQFFTPLPIARLMASYCTFSGDRLRILDPGCGTGVLTCALIEYLIENNQNLTKIDLVAYETDEDLILFSQQTFLYLEQWLGSKNVVFCYVLHVHDFILDNAKSLKIGCDNSVNFDVIISNPPYFKLAKDDARNIATKELVSGQSNIYSIFMGIASKLLNINGALIFITPRSFASGNYFKAFRTFFFNSVQIEKIHLFNSRKNTFKRDRVLQETVIVKALNSEIKTDNHVVVSSSNGVDDILNSKSKSFPLSILIDLNSKDKILHLPTNDKEESILSLVKSWDNNLSNYNIDISTGPVVSFRSLDFIYSNYESRSVLFAPLYWLHNVNKMNLVWPVALKNKGQYMKIEEDSKCLLIPNKNYILVRRFSTKDDKSRLIAAPFFCTDADNSPYIGVENKVNYIYRKNGYLEKSEVAGLCSLLNSELFDVYFQIFNGNVNVSATELRGMRFPFIKDIKEIGNQLLISNDISMKNVNKIVNDYFKLESILKK